MTASGASILREQVHELADELPEDATWDDVMYAVYLRRKIERGLADVEAGRTYSMDEIKKEFGLLP